MDVDKNYITKHDKLLRLMQMKIEEATPEYARVTMPLLEQHKNGMGVAHGGAIFALADVAFGGGFQCGSRLWRGQHDVQHRILASWPRGAADGGSQGRENRRPYCQL